LARAVLSDSFLFRCTAWIFCWIPACWFSAGLLCRFLLFACLHSSLFVLLVPAVFWVSVWIGSTCTNIPAGTRSGLRAFCCLHLLPASFVLTVPRYRSVLHYRSAFCRLPFCRFTCLRTLLTCVLVSGSCHRACLHCCHRSLPFSCVRFRFCHSSPFVHQPTCGALPPLLPAVLVPTCTVFCRRSTCLPFTTCLPLPAVRSFYHLRSPADFRSLSVRSAGTSRWVPATWVPHGSLPFCRSANTSVLHCHLERSATAACRFLPAISGYVLTCHLRFTCRSLGRFRSDFVLRSACCLPAAPFPGCSSLPLPAPAACLPRWVWVLEAWVAACCTPFTLHSAACLPPLGITSADLLLHLRSACHTCRAAFWVRFCRFSPPPVRLMPPPQITACLPAFCLPVLCLLYLLRSFCSLLRYYTRYPAVSPRYLFIPLLPLLVPIACRRHRSNMEQNRCSTLVCRFLRGTL